MLRCEYGNIRDYGNCSYEELLELRSRVLSDIESFEDASLEENWKRKPGSDYEYRLNLEFLADLIVAINRKFLFENMELQKAIASGEFQAEPNEGRASQVMRYTRIRRESGIEEVEDNFIEFTITDVGTLEAYYEGEHAGTVKEIDAIDNNGVQAQFNQSGSYLILSAECHNQKYMGPGSLKRTEWSIYHDGTYQIKKEFNLNWEEFESATSDESEAGKTKIISGKLDEEQFEILLDALDRPIWRNAEIQDESRDGSKWLIIMYDCHGNVINSSGELGTITGNRNLEVIISNLPQEKRW